MHRDTLKREHLTWKPLCLKRIQPSLETTTLQHECNVCKDEAEMAVSSPSLREGKVGVISPLFTSNTAYYFLLEEDFLLWQPCVVGQPANTEEHGLYLKEMTA